ncbi:MAG TPA: hypothetical protein VKQ29_08035 [Aliidongia sp.]|nr:hypothetical protein [Aliidongia sp.]
MIAPPPRHWIPWYLRLTALGFAAIGALYVIVLYAYGIKFVDLVSSLRPPPDPPVVAHDPPPPPSEPGVVTFSIGQPKPPGQ